MARLPRIDLPGIAQHIVQRGVDRQPALPSLPTTPVTFVNSAKQP